MLTLFTYNKSFLNAYFIKKKKKTKTNVWWSTLFKTILYFNSFSVLQKKKKSKIKNTKTYIRSVFPEADATEPCLGFQSDFSSSGDGFALIHSHTLIQSLFDQSLRICKDNHSRLKVDSAGMNKDNWLSTVYPNACQLTMVYSN